MIAGRPASLRGRVVATFLIVLVLLLAGLFTTVDLLLTSRLHSDLRTRLIDRVALADQLDGALSPQQLVNRLRGDGVEVVLCSASSQSSSRETPRCVRADSAPVAPPSPQRGGAPERPAADATDGPPAPSRPRPRADADTPVRSDGSVLYVRTTLPSSGHQLTLSVDAGAVTSVLNRLILLEVIAGAITVLIAGLVLFRLVGTALRPLDTMTGLARRIASGDRGRRLRTGRADTELGRTASAFDAMLDELETALTAASAAEARQRRFLNDVSHELRTPLAGAAATVETLLRDEPNRVARENAYVTLMREMRRASRLVDDLLTATRLDSGQPLDVERVDLADVVGQVVTRARALAPGARIDQRGLAPAVADADAVRVAQIVTNLVSNALRAAGRAGVVTIEIGRIGGGWSVDVSDDGPGVPPAERDRIFERLVRLDDSRASGTGGFGLGLSIARALARAHGGDLACLPPAPAGGALFRLTLPATAATAVSLPAQSEPAPSAGSRYGEVSIVGVEGGKPDGRAQPGEHGTR